MALPQPTDPHDPRRRRPPLSRRPSRKPNSRPATSGQPPTKRLRIRKARIALATTVCWHWPTPISNWHCWLKRTPPADRTGQAAEATAERGTARRGQTPPGSGRASRTAEQPPANNRLPNSPAAEQPTPAETEAAAQAAIAGAKIATKAKVEFKEPVDHDTLRDILKTCSAGRRRGADQSRVRGWQSSCRIALGKSRFRWTRRPPNKD